MYDMIYHGVTFTVEVTTTTHVPFCHFDMPAFPHHTWNDACECIHICHMILYYFTTFPEVPGELFRDTAVTYLAASSLGSLQIQSVGWIAQASVARSTSATDCQYCKCH